MNRRYSIAASASQDLDRISEYYANRSIEAGERLFQEFNRKCQNLVLSGVNNSTILGKAGSEERGAGE